jgi:hypothetical protein
MNTTQPVQIAPATNQPVAAIIAMATAALREAATARAPSLEDVARWCAEIGGVDPHLERAALHHARRLVDTDVLVADLGATLRARLAAAGPALPALIARGGIPRVLGNLGLDDVDPPAGAMTRAVPPRIARFYWQRLRAYVSWTASCAWC